MGFLALFRKKTTTRSDSSGIDPAIIKKYNKSRTVSNKQLLCHAPFSNLYFNTEGDVALCWKTFHRAEKYTPDKSLMEIWQGSNFKRIREGIHTHNLDFGCLECKKHLQEGNFVNVLSKAYDNDHIDPDFPTIMEFELSNQCNLACTMCNGMLSSVIRKDREHLPKLISPYGDRFVEDLKPFIPHLKEARFNGGEPFLIKLYYKIWDEIFALNPNLKMVVATNGTVLTEKVKSYLERGNFHINLSIDGFTKSTYESIRIKGDHDKLMENFEYFHEYCQKGKRTFCIMVNPLRDNWQEMPDFVRFCNEKNIHLWFNSIIKPAELALWSLPAEELEQIYTVLSSHKFSAVLTTGAIQRYNIKTYENLVHQQIKTWWEEAIAREAKDIEYKELDPAKCKALALARIDTLLSDVSTADKNSVIIKLDQLEATIQEEKNLALFYKSILDTNPKLLLEMTQTYSVEELKAMFLEHVQAVQ